MYLVNTNSLQLESFLEIPPSGYAILSHTWGKEEVTYQDFGQPKAEQMAGWAKITGACAVARREGFQHIWIDTCCIDKTSSAELSEAINSMFKWYAKADLCYAYLDDVPSSDCCETALHPTRTPLENARWFTRGWTLQELLAPSEVIFLSKDWKEIGTKRSLRHEVAEITRIDSAMLQMQRSLASYSVAQRMSWASRRKTTREEDEAYCLMGLFDVNMPLLYGEGDKAFKRLQLEIMKETYDSSILSWALHGSLSKDSMTGVLASHVSAFETCSHIHLASASPSKHITESTQDFNIKGKTLKLTALVYELVGQPLFLSKPKPPYVRNNNREPLNATSALRSLNLSDFGRYWYRSSVISDSGPRSRFLILLPNCLQRTVNPGGSSEAYVGIVVSIGNDGNPYRFHHPSRFLLPAEELEQFPGTPQACHILLSGPKKVELDWSRHVHEIVVRMLTNHDSNLPYSTVIDENTQRILKRNSYHENGIGFLLDFSDISNSTKPRAPTSGLLVVRTGSWKNLTFQHCSDSTRWFIFTYGFAHYPRLGRRVFVGLRQGAVTEVEGSPQGSVPEPPEKPQFDVSWPLDEEWMLAIKIRNTPRCHFVVLEFLRRCSRRMD